MAKKKPTPPYLRQSGAAMNFDALDAYMNEPVAAPQEEKESGRTLGGTVKDAGISLLKGVISVPEAGVGLANLATFGDAGRLAEQLGVDFNRSKQILDDNYSDAQKQANRNFAEADGFGGKAMAAIENPSVVLHAGVESVPQMLAGGAIGRGVMAVAPRLTPAIAAGIGEGIVGAGSAAESIRQQTQDGAMTAGQVGSALASGAGTALFGALGNKVAKRLGIGDVDTMIAAGSVDAGVRKGMTRSFLEGAMAEGLLEELPQSVQEQAWQNFATDRPLDEGMDDAAVLGLFTGGLMGGGAGVVGNFGASRAEATDPLMAKPSDEVRALKTGGAGAISRAVDTGLETEAKKLDAQAPQPISSVVQDVLAEQIPEPAAQNAPTTPEVDVIGRMHSQAAEEMQGLRDFSRPVAMPEPVAPTPMSAPQDDEPMSDPVARPSPKTFGPESLTPEGIRESLDEVEQRNQAVRDLYAPMMGDILNPKGEPFKNETAAKKALSKAGGGEVLQVHGGWVVRPAAQDAEVINGDTSTVARVPARSGDDGRGDAGRGVGGVRPDADGTGRGVGRIALPAPAGTPGNQPAGGATGVNDAAVTAQGKPAFHSKTVPQMTDDELRQAAEFYGAKHKRTKAIEKEMAKRVAAVAAPADMESGKEISAETSKDTVAVQGASAVTANHEQAQATADQKSGDAGPDVAKDAAGAQKLVGDKIDDEWTAFHQDSGTLAIPRADMPQVKAEHRGAMVQFLKGKGIEHEQDEVQPSELKPTQAEFSPAKVQKAKEFTEGDRSILVSQDGHVVDGHHQWIAKHEAGDPVKVIRLKAPIKYVLEKIKEFPSAEQDAGADGSGQVSQQADPGAARGDEAGGSRPAPEAKPTTTDAQREAAQAHARDMGGRVVWQDGDLALIEGFSVLTGDPVYTAANGSTRTRVDIKAYTGKGFTPEQKAQLLAARAEVVKAADEAAARDSEGPFKAGRLVFADDISPKVAEVAKGWADLLGLGGVRIVVTTPESGATMAEGLAGRFRRIGKAKLSGENTNGVMQPLGNGDYHIAISPQVSVLKTLEVLAHEMGHITERHAYAEADEVTKAAIRQAHAEWLQANGKGAAVDMAKSMRAYRSGQTTGFSDDAAASEASAYWKSFGEWFADQVSRWATSEQKPLSVVDQFFHRLGKALRAFFVGERAKFKPGAVMVKWLDSLSKDVPPVDLPAEAAPVAESVQPEADNNRDLFTIERPNKETGRMEPVKFERGEYIKAWISSSQADFGEIDGISQANREFSVNGIWHPMGAAYKAERPAAPTKKTELLSKTIEKVNAKSGEGLTDADRVPEKKSASKTPTVDRHMEVMEAARNGKGSIADYKASFAALESGEAAVKAELATKTKDDLLRAGGAHFYMRYKSETKPDIIKAFYNDLLSEYALGKTYGSNSFIMSSGGMAAHHKRQHEALKALVEAQTQEDLDNFAKEIAERRAEYKAEREAKQAAMANPQTLGDFRSLLNAKIREGMARAEAFLTLTPEQRIKYDELEAESTKESREAAKRAAKTAVRSAGQTTAGEIVATKHTRDGHNLWVVKLADRLSTDDYRTVLASAKRLGGSYSSFRGNGAIPGFQFRTPEAAQAFLKLAGGDTTEAQGLAEQRRDAFDDDRNQSAVERLNEMADKLDERAQESIDRDRKTNTTRRARFAASADREAQEAKALAQTMRNIAKAIEEGRAKFLDGVRTKTQVELLRNRVAAAKQDELRSKHPTYAEQEKRRGEPATAETADFAEFPSFTAFRSDLASLARQMLEVDGTKKLGQQLMSVADDVTDAYIEFAKKPENLYKLSTFSIRQGDDVKTAIFPSKDMAERAIRRSGLADRAIVLPEKRVVNRIIMSPSEAMSRGVWTGDGDKRITLTREFGSEMVQAIGRRGSKTNRLTVPWQFQTAYDRLNALKRIGIETPSEYRSALREFIGLQERAIVNKVREMELSMAGRKNDGLDFFPTPAEVADQMVAAADISPDMAVLEPSAGMGHIADRIREAGAEPDVIELAEDRRELLQEKGYNLADFRDFMDMKPRQFFTYGDVFRAPDGTEGVMSGSGGMGSSRVILKPLMPDGSADSRRGEWYDRDGLVGVRHRGTESGYDRIIMNPPFSNVRDIEHVMHAYDLLKPGGRIVAIMGESAFFNQSKKAEAFRQWLDDKGGTSEKLPAGSFMDPSLPVNTGVNARMVVIDKPNVGEQEPGNFSRQPEDESFYRSPGISIKDAKSIARQLEESGLVKVNVVENIDQMPDDKRARVLSRVPKGDIRGVYFRDADEVWVVTKYLNSPDEFTFVALHEAFHRGLAKTIPGAKPLLRNMWESNQNLRKLTKQQMDLHGIGRDEAIEEALADMAGLGTARDLAGWDKFVAMLKKWLGDIMAGVGIKVEWTDDMIEDFVAGMTTEGLRNGGVHVATEVPVMARGKIGAMPESTKPGPNGEQRTGADQGNAAAEAFRGFGPQPHYAPHQNLAATFELAGMDVKESGSSKSGSRYVTIDDPVGGDTVTVRFADHRQTGNAISLHGVPDFEVGDFDGANFATWQEARDAVFDRINKERARHGDDPLQLPNEQTAPDSQGAMFSRASMAQEARQSVLDFFGDAGARVNWLDKTLKTQYAKAQKFPAFGRVFNKVQDYIEGISTFANQAADMAPDILPKLESWKDIKRGDWSSLLRHGLSTQDSEALAAPVFEGTLNWGRDESGKLVPMDDLEAKAEKMAAEEKAAAMVRARALDPKVLRMWQGLPMDQFETMVNGKYEREMLQAGVVFTDAELKALYNLTPEQIGHYRQFRAAVDESLDQVASADAIRLLGKKSTPELKAMASTKEGRRDLRAAVEEMVAESSDPAIREAERAAAALRRRADELDARADGSDDAEESRALKRQASEDRREAQKRMDKASNAKLWNDIADKFNRVDSLKARGYAPLTRFGKFYVHVTGVDGETLYFGLEETARDSNRTAREIAKEYPDAKVSQGVMSQEAYRLMAQVPVSSMELFAEAIGADKSEVFQNYIRMAKNNRSTLKRLIRRKGTKGFSMDAPRVLASFVTSNARATSSAMHIGEAEAMAKEVREGDVQDEAVKLVKSVTEPEDTGSAIRSLMFVNFIGGSIASAVVNLTQPVMMTLPYLSQWGGMTKASKRLVASAKMAAGGRIADPGLRQALKIAEDNGTVEPQEIHHLLKQASSGMSSMKVAGPVLQKLAFLWGTPFSLAEQFNRRSSFIAAYMTAKEEGVSDPQAFAEKAVVETQGLYNTGNRMNWSRNPVGAAALTFKQFSIHYLEWLGRMSKNGPQGKRAVAWSIALMILAAGADGLPFMADLDDLLDTIGQAMGYDLNTKRSRREFADNILGKELGALATRGFSAAGGFPVDVSMRMGMGNLVPATDIFLKSNTDTARSLSEFAGAAGGMFEQYREAVRMVLAGNPVDAATKVSPVAIQNLVKAATMAATGEYRDTKDRKVMDTDMVDAGMKSLGFQPASVARESAMMSQERRSEQLAKVVEAEIVDTWARSVADGETERVQEARQRLAAWNRSNSDMPIKITPRQIRQRVKALKQTRAERYLKTVAPERRSAAREVMGGGE